MQILGTCPYTIRHICPVHWSIFWNWICQIFINVITNIWRLDIDVHINIEKYLTWLTKRWIDNNNIINLYHHFLSWILKLYSWSKGIKKQSWIRNIKWSKRCLPVSGYYWITSMITWMESGKIWRWKCADKADHFGNIEDPGILCTSNIDFPFSLQPTIYTLSIQSDQGTRDPPSTSSRDIGWNPFLEIKLNFFGHPMRRLH